MPKRPNTYRELLEMHPFELCLSSLLLLMGIRGLFSTASTSAAVDSTTSGSLWGTIISLTWQVGVILGAGTVLAALLTSPLAAHRGLAAESRNRTYEQVGLVLLGTTAFVYAIIIMFTAREGGAYAVGQSMSIGLACMLRIRRLRRADKETLHGLQMITRGNGSEA